MIQGCLLEAGLSRGDLTEAEWRILKDFLPIERKNRGRGRPPEQNRSIINGILWRLRCAVARRAAQIRKLEHHLSPVPPMERGWRLRDPGADAGRDHGRHRPLQHR
nr:transposase [Sphingomonas sp. PL-96]